MADFIFRLPSGEEVGKAGNIEEFRDALDSVPDISIEFHYHGGHFRPWLTDAGHEKLASELEKVEVDDDRRQKLLGVTRRYIRRVKLEGSG